MRKKITHAPAPWCVFAGEVISADGEKVCCVYRAEGWSSGDPIRYQEQGDAALLSAALDMFSALDDLVKDCDLHDPLWSAACDAVAKAKGKSS